MSGATLRLGWVVIGVFGGGGYFGSRWCFWYSHGGGRPNRRRRCRVHPGCCINIGRFLGQVVWEKLPCESDGSLCRLVCFVSAASPCKTFEPPSPLRLIFLLMPSLGPHFLCLVLSKLLGLLGHPVQRRVENPKKASGRVHCMAIAVSSSMAVYHICFECSCLTL